MTPHAELRAALSRLDIRLAREVARLRARYQLSLDEFRGLFVSDEHVDALLRQNDAAPLPNAPLPRLRLGPRFAGVVRRFGLSEGPVELLLLALAPELDPKYATLIAYLNDDARRRQPTFDLAWRLFGDATRALDLDGPLIGANLVVLDNAAGRNPQSLQEFSAHPLLAAHLLGLSSQAFPGVTAMRPESNGPSGALADLAPLLESGGRPPVVVLTGRAMSGRAAAVRRLGRPVVHLDLADAAAPEPRLKDAVLAARLADAVLLIDPGPAGFAPLARFLREPPLPVFLRPAEDASWRHSLAGCALVEVAFVLPDAAIRRELWTAALARAGLGADAEAIGAVARRFRLAAPQIDAAAESLRLAHRLGPAGRAVLGAEPLAGAARAQSSAGLAGMATRMVPRHGWSDLVLPAATVRQLRHFGAAIRHRELVFGEWGFARGAEAGLIALFSGGSGTGKSISAGVLASEAGLEIWRIDLSAVVSKYIGETEKQLERIFTLARDGNALLFFDEADALFGKRSEVKDAHDRYANIEVAFLLQRLEAYDGVAILATNLARNVDRAFSRRMHVIIEFPLPDAPLRERLWRQAFPSAAPLAADVDFGFLGRQFAFAGGDIRVAALDAAFAAAADGAAIDMARLLQAVARQLLKQGKVPAASDFRQYHALLGDAAEPAVRAIAAE